MDRRLFTMLSILVAVFLPKLIQKKMVFPYQEQIIPFSKVYCYGHILFS